MTIVLIILMWNRDSEWKLGKSLCMVSLIFDGPKVADARVSL